MKLGRLKRIEPRHAWQTEDRHFTPWLAQDENIELLSETLGLDLEVEAQEKQVGPFRADILCKDRQSEAFVLIENQLEKTDHKHLGQLITYASGLKTAYIVWVATKFHEEHRAALDWLNTISDEEFKFFGLEVELWSIGDSEYAPKFNIVCKPNEWSRNTREGLKNVEDGLSDIKQLQRRFWEYLKEHLKTEHNIHTQKARAQNWLNTVIGKTDVHITCTCNSITNTIGVGLYIGSESATEIFNALKLDAVMIENELGFEVEWQALEQKRASRIQVYRENSFLSDENTWPVLSQWLGEKVAKFDSVFRRRLQEL